MIHAKALVARTLNRTAVAAIVAMLGATCLSSCSTVSRLNPLNRGDKGPQATATQGERVPVIFADDKVKVADALKGQDFTLPDAQPIADWPQPGGPVGQAPENVQAGAAFQIAWRRGVGAGSNRKQHLTAPPVAAGGRIYTLDAQATVTATEARSGARIWSRDLRPNERRDRAGFGGGVAYADGKLYVTSGFRFVAALDAASGSVVWRTSVEAPIHGAPSVAAGKVYAVNIDDKLAAFDVATGQEVWNFQGLTEPARILAASSPAVTDTAVVAAFASGELVSLLPANGNDLWSQSLSRSSRNNALSEIRDIAGRPVISRDTVYAVSHSGVFAAVDLRTGGGKWVLPVSSIATPWAAGDVVYVVSKAGELICVQRDTGQIFWIRDLNDGSRPQSTRRFFGLMRGAKIPPYWFGPVLASGRLVMVSSTGQALALDPKTGATQRTLDLGGAALLSPIAAGDMLYVLRDDGQLVAIR
jgi:outer membrane protein assembly factor BamB